MPTALPYIGLGLGIYQTISSQNTQQRAIDEARRPRLSTEQQATLRREGTSNIQSNLATRGLLDSSLFPGGLAQLEKGIGEASAGTMGDVSGLLSMQAMGQGQSGSNLIGSAAEMYLLRQFLGRDPWSSARDTSGIIPASVNTGRPWYPSPSWDPSWGVPPGTF